MAFWNAPLDDPGHADHACESALAMVRELDRINVELEREADSRRPGFPSDPYRHRAQHRRMCRRQHGLGRALCLHGDGRRGEPSLPPRRPEQELSRDNRARRRRRAPRPRPGRRSNSTLSRSRASRMRYASIRCSATPNGRNRPNSAPMPSVTTGCSRPTGRRIGRRRTPRCASAVAAVPSWQASMTFTRSVLPSTRRTRPAPIGTGVRRGDEVSRATVRRSPASSASEGRRLRPSCRPRTR